jgi:hypothetical protein
MRNWTLDRLSSFFSHTRNLPDTSVIKLPRDVVRWADPKAFEQSYTPKHNYRVTLAMKMEKSEVQSVITGTTNKNVLISRFHDARSGPLGCKTITFWKQVGQSAFRDPTEFVSSFSMAGC